MSEPRKFPAGLLFFVIFTLLGLAVTAACLAGAAQWMVIQGYSGHAAFPLTTTAVCIGSFSSALAAALWKRQHGLATGLIQGVLLAAVLAALAMFSGTAAEPLHMFRMAVAILCGGVGGLLSVAIRERRHPLR